MKNMQNDSTHYLAIRDNWQEYAARTSRGFEMWVDSVLKEVFTNPKYVVIYKPKMLQCLHIFNYLMEKNKQILTRKPNNPKVFDNSYHLNSFYIDKNGIIYYYSEYNWKIFQSGIAPDHLIYNSETNNLYFIESKKQGDRGNTDERAASRITPGIIKTIREYLGLTEKYHPIGLAFGGKIVTSARYKLQHINIYRGFLEHVVHCNSKKKFIKYLMNTVKKQIDVNNGGKLRYPIR